MHYINGLYTNDASPQVSIADLGFVRGFGVFDFLRTYAGKPFHLQDHLDRLFYSAHILRLEIAHSPAEIASIVEKLLLENNYPESSIKIIATGNISPDQFLPSGPASLIILANPLKSFPEAHYIQGIKVATTPLQRSFPWAKTLHYAPAIVAMQEAKALGVQEILYLTKDREILEAATSNFFAIKENTLITAPETADILVGITRNVLLKLAESVFSIEERLLSVEELSSCDEAFIASSTRELMPIIQVDHQLIGQGVPGPSTKILMKLFSNYAKSLAWPPLTISRHTALATLAAEK